MPSMEGVAVKPRKIVVIVSGAMIGPEADNYFDRKGTI